ncbi:GntR family transcriptional regulator [Nocardioides sp. Soil797]|nr:GntR family transcriptional regulator [Nocardioides sp. Soil797]
MRDVITGLPVGAPAPSERDLVQRFGVARMTVRQAIETLVAEGLVERIPGRGTFVVRPPTRVGQLRSFTDEMNSRGLRPESQTLLLRREKAGPGVARALMITEGDSVIHWQRLRRADRDAICLEDAYLSEVLLPGFLNAPIPTSLYADLTGRGLRPNWAEDSVRADLASEREARVLGLEPGAPVLRIERRALRDDKVIEVSRSTYRSDRFTLWVQFSHR